MAAITNYAYKGRGRVYYEGRELGNISALEISFAVTEQVQKDYRTCAGGNYASSIDIDEANISMTLHDLSPENVNMAFYGTSSAITATGVTDEAITAPSDLASGDRFVKTAFAMVTTTGVTVTTTGATPYTSGTDYTARPAGILIYTAGSISASESLLIDYTKRAATRVETLMSSSISGELIIEGLNCAQSGAPVVIRVWSFKPSPAEAFQIISEEFASFTLNGKADADSTKDPNSQYFQIDVATTT